MKDESCHTCAYLSPCKTKCYNPHNNFQDFLIPFKPNGFVCLKWRSALDESVIKHNEQTT